MCYSRLALACALLCLLSCAVPAAAEEEVEPKKGARDAERAAALAEAKRLEKQLNVLYRKGEYKEATVCARKALALREAVLSPEDPLVADSLSNLGVLLRVQGEYAAARPLYERALRILEEVRGPHHPNVGAALSNLGVLLTKQGDYERAEPLYRRALAIQERAHGPEHADLAGMLNNLGLLLKNRGAYEEARGLYERALRIREKALGPRHAKVVSILNNLAVLLRGLGAYAEARAHYQRALDIAGEAFGQEHPRLALLLNNLGKVLEKQGDGEAAELFYRRALRIWEARGGAKHPQVGFILVNIASVLLTRGALESAQALAERALTIFETALGPEHPDVAMALKQLAAVLRARGKAAQARPLCERALQILESSHGGDSPMVASASTSLASVLLTLGAAEKALPLYKRALAIWETAFGLDNPDVVQCLGNIASAYHALGKPKETAEVLTLALERAERHLRGNLAALHGAERRVWGRRVRHILAAWLDIAPSVGRSGYPEVLRFKGLLTRVAMAERRLARQGATGAHARVNNLRAAERRLAQLANAMPPLRYQDRKARWQKAYARAAVARQRLAVALARDFAPYREGLERLDLTRSDVQAALSEDARLVDCLRTRGHYIAWVVPPRGTVVRVDLGEAKAIEDAAAAFAAKVADPGESGATQAGRALRDLIVNPLVPHLGPRVQKLFICPDAALAAVPFSALPGSGKDAKLGEGYTTTSISMAQELVPWANAGEPGAGALVLGGVDYGKATARVAAATPLVLVDRAPRGGRFLYLEGTKREVAAIRPVLGDQAAAALGSEATEAWVRATAHGKRVLHLATHGFVRTDLLRGLSRRGKNKHWLGFDLERQLTVGHDPLNLSGLALAGANTRRGGGADDGILTALEASYLDLDGVELVVLSACSTALGTAESGEGVIGLVRGFQMAGAKRVIGSLWRVDDDATRALMTKFYELWTPKKGRPRIAASAALRDAQAFVRSQPAWKHPYYWAAWTVWGVGD